MFGTFERLKSCRGWQTPEISDGFRASGARVKGGFSIRAIALNRKAREPACHTFGDRTPDHPTPMGPPPSVKFSEARVRDILTGAGFQAEDAFTLGENMYCLTAVSPSSN